MKQRRSDRSFLRLAAIPLVAALVAASCGGGGSDGGKSATGDSKSSGAETKPDTMSDTKSGDDGSGTAAINVTIPSATDMTPVDGGTLRYALEADVDGLNPTVSAVAAASGLQMASAVYDTLAEYGTDGKYVPYLAESFTPNADFTEWDIKLREGVTFHDGTPLDAEAVVFNFNAQRDNPLVGLAVKPFFAETDPFTVVDPLTVHVKLVDANSQWPTTVTGQLGMMASPTWLKAALADPTLNQKPVGTGPFKFEARSENSETSFVRNDAWWNGHVYLDKVVFKPVTDFTDRNDLLIKGDVDAEHNTDPSAILDLREEPGIQLIEDDSGSETFVMMNTAVPPFNDIRARQALAWATPRQDYEALIGLDVTRMADQRFTPDSPFYNPDVKQVGDDPAKAAELAAEYCAEKGTETNPITEQPTCTDGKINIEYQWSGPSTANTRTAEMFTDTWSAAGFNIKPDELLQAAHIQQVALGQYNSVLYRLFSAPNPTNDNVWVMCRTIGGISLNFAKNCNEELDKALLSAGASTDDATRAAAFQQGEQLINDQYQYIFLVHTLWAFGFAGNVHGVCDRKSPEGVPLKCSVDGRTWHSSVWIEQ